MGEQGDHSQYGARFIKLKNRHDLKKKKVLNFRNSCLCLRFWTNIYHDTYLAYPDHFYVKEAGEFSLVLMPWLRSLPSQRIDPVLIEVNGNFIQYVWIKF